MIEKMSVEDFVKQHRISDDPIIYRFDPKDMETARKFMEDRIEPNFNHQRAFIFGFKRNLLI